MPPPPAVPSHILQVEQLKKTNEQFKRELNIKRAKFSDSAKEIIAYCENSQRNDPLIHKVPASENPFRERGRGCAVL